MNQRILAALILAGTLLAPPAFAQVLQSGSVSPGHATSWATNGVIQDGGTAGNGKLNTLGITATGTPFCINDAAVTGQYHQFCLGANSLGGGLLSYNAYGGASSLPLQVNINGVTTTLGTGTVTSGTAGQLTYYGTTGQTVSGNPSLNISSGALTIGQAGSVLGSAILAGSSSGAVSLLPQAAAGTWNFNLPITAGTSGQVLTSAGGGSSPMTWTTIGGTVVSGTIGQTAYYASGGTAVSGTSALILTASAATMSPSGNVVISPGGTVTMSPTGAVTMNPGGLSTIDNTTIGGTTKAAGSFTTLLATGQISSGVAASSLGSIALSGNSGGTVIIKPQASAGSYNFNLPITAGTTGQPLLSGGGGAGAMTYGSLSGNTGTFATTSGSLTNGHAAAFDASGNIVDGGTLPTGSINSGTAGQMTYYAGTGTTLSGNSNVTYSSGALTVGTTGSQAGSFLLSGSSTGTITLKGSGTAIGTYNFNFPTTAGTSGQPLLSGGGAASAMVYGTVSGNTNKFVNLTGSLTNGNCVAADASGNLIDNGSPCGSGGSGTVTSSTAGQIAYYPSSTNAVAGNSSLTISGSTVTVGVSTTSLGVVALAGNSSGLVSIKPQAAAGTWNFNLPTTAGTAGQVLTSQGGGSTAMTWGGAGIAWGTTQATGFTAVVNTSYAVDTTGGAVTVTLPASPADGDLVNVFDATGNWGVSKVTLARNGHNIMNLASDMDITTPNGGVTVRYLTATTNWRIVQ